MHYTPFRQKMGCETHFSLMGLCWEASHVVVYFSCQKIQFAIKNRDK